MAHIQQAIITQVNNNMITVYLKTPQAQYWLDRTGVQYELANDLDQWTASTNQRVALIEPLDYDTESQQLIQHCCQHGDLIILFMTELITDSWCRQFDLPNVVLFLNGSLNWTPQQARLGKCMYFFWSTCDFYRTFPDLLNFDSTQADKFFDVLLGRRKSHRDQLYENIDHDLNTVTYFPTHSELPIRDYCNQEFIWPDMLDKSQHEVCFTAQEVTVNGVIVSLSQIIPKTVYQHTHYTVVAETQSDNEWSFFTEKIVKPILARRLFLVAAGQYYLENLRELGFKTFENVIDESYDREPDQTLRISMLIEQVRYLQTQDPVQIKAQIQSILDHNFNHMMQRDWQKDVIIQLAQVLE